MTVFCSSLFPGNQHPWHFQKQLVMSSLVASQKHHPLRHSIDAILHKTSSSSPSSNPSASPKPTLPHIETLRRNDVTTVSASLPPLTKSAYDVEIPRCVAGRFDEGDESRADPSSQSSFDSCEELEDVVVVDETNDSAPAENEPTDAQTGERKEHGPGTPFTTQKLHQTLHLSSQHQALAATRSAFKPNTNLNAAAAETRVKRSEEKEKSAFRPIVRPWLVGEGSALRPARDVQRASSSPSSSAAAAGKERFRAVRTVSTTQARFAAGSALTSLDAISMLRRQSSAFRIACSNGNGNGRPEVSRHHNVATTAATSCSRPRLENGVSVGQPLPSTLASWFSWLRSGAMHFGTQPPPQQFLPGAATAHPHPHCRGVVVPPSTSSPAHSLTHTHAHAHPHVPAAAQPAPRYNCEACGKSYSTFGGLSKHKQFHCSAQIKKDFRCKYCDKSYSSLGALKMHIRTHTLPCKCSVCGKAFSRPWLLQGHLRTHTGEKPFSCPHCARAFADRSNLRAHLQTHSDVKKYSCRHCSKTFSRMSLLLKHRESSCVALHR